MVNFLNSLFETNFPSWVFIAIPAALVLLVLYILWLVRTRIFKMRLRRIVNAKEAHEIEEAVKSFSRHYSPETLVRYSRRMERYSRQMGPQVVRETGLADKWTHKVAHSPLVRAVDIRRVLLYCPSSAAFKAFLAAEQHPRLRKVFFNWMNKEGEEKAIRLLAESCKGEDFDPAFCKSFLEKHSALLRELTGEPEWYVRYFAYKILQLDKEPVTERTLEAGLYDPNPLTRKTLTKSFSAGREKTWNILWDKLIHDPVYEVREAARKRIAKEYMDLYNLKEKNLNEEETSRILEQLDPASQEDRTFAMAALESPSLEQSYLAAVFLDKCGVLYSLLIKNTLDDLKNIDHSVNLLQKAMNVNVSGFLREYPSGDGAPLLAAARLLSAAGGTQEAICQLARKVFLFFSSKKLEPSNTDIYTKTLEAVAAHGSIKSFELIGEELIKRENDPPFLKLLLTNFPSRAERMLTPALFRFLENAEFPLREELVHALGAFNPAVILPEVFRILNVGQDEYPRIVRISALKILGYLHQPFCLKRILESLPTLTPKDTEEFAGIVAAYPREMFEEKARELLASPDALIRAYLINILPITKNESHIKDIRLALKDVDPDVRVAAIKALLGYGEVRLLNQETSMLRDPVERVRLTTAEVIAEHGNAAAMEILKNILTDTSETDVVKQGVIAGLGQASGAAGGSAESLSILVDVMDTMGELSEYAVKALAKRTSKRDILQLVEIFKDAEPSLREKLIPVFKGQGKDAEPRIIEILKEEVASFKPYLVKILEETGYVDEAKRKLSHRNVEVRREAAMMLSLLDTLQAFRSLVMAAKDPDQEVRVCVVRALEKLKSSQSRDLLEKLKDDPDNRIRKYTHWALERLDSLAMD
jgi:HEAT repeat protein